MKRRLSSRTDLLYRVYVSMTNENYTLTKGSLDKEKVIVEYVRKHTQIIRIIMYRRKLM